MKKKDLPFAPENIEELEKPAIEVDAATGFRLSYEGTYEALMPLDVKAGTDNERETVVSLKNGAVMFCNGRFEIDKNNAIWLFVTLGEDTGFVRKDDVKRCC